MEVRVLLRVLCMVLKVFVFMKVYGGLSKLVIEGSEVLSWFLQFNDI